MKGTYRLFFQRDSTKRKDFPCSIHREEDGKLFDAKEVKIYGQAVTEFNHSVKSIPTFVLVCVGELRWNGSTAYLVSKGSYERKR